MPLNELFSSKSSAVPSTAPDSRARSNSDLTLSPFGCARIGGHGAPCGFLKDPSFVHRREPRASPRCMRCMRATCHADTSSEDNCNRRGLAWHGILHPRPQTRRMHADPSVHGHRLTLGFPSGLPRIACPLQEKHDCVRTKGYDVVSRERAAVADTVHMPVIHETCERTSSRHLRSTHCRRRRHRWSHHAHLHNHATACQRSEAASAAKASAAHTAGPSPPSFPRSLNDLICAIDASLTRNCESPRQTAFEQLGVAVC